MKQRFNTASGTKSLCEGLRIFKDFAAVMKQCLKTAAETYNMYEGLGIFKDFAAVMKQLFNTNNEMTVSLNNSMSHISPTIPMQSHAASCTVSACSVSRGIC